jgi:hypothetical protein
MEIKIPYTPRSYQREIHNLMDQHRFFVLVAHRRLGKTVLSINQLIKRMFKDGKDQGRYGYIAPFRNQGKLIAWDYLKRYVKDIPNKRIYENDLRIRFHNSNEIRIFGADNPDNIRGQYFDGVIVDEVAQIKRELWEDVLRPAISDRQGWAIFIGTPSGINFFYELYERAGQGGEWGRARYDIKRTMLSADPPLALEEVENCQLDMPRGNFAREYLCDFSVASDDSLIDLALAVEASQRVLAPGVVDGQPCYIGVDVARFGDDKTALAVRKGPAVVEVESFQDLKTDEVVSRIIAAERAHAPDMIFVDSGGPGGGVVDYGRKVLAAKVIDVPFGSQAKDDARYVNRRSEMWDDIRKFLKAGGAIPDDKELVTQLAAPYFSYDEAGRLKLEPKARMRKRGASPDKADAVALTFAHDLLPAKLRDAVPARVTRRRGFWDPGTDWM